MKEEQWLCKCGKVINTYPVVSYAGCWEVCCLCKKVIKESLELYAARIHTNYHDIDGNYDLYKNGKHQNNTGIQPSLMYKDFE